MQSLSDDASHDEALSSRIAAVNLLDLTLDHLGVDVSNSATAVESIIKACGESVSYPVVLEFGHNITPIMQL